MDLQKFLQLIPEPDLAWTYHSIPHHHAGWGLEMRVEQLLRKNGVNFIRNQKLDELGIDYIFPLRTSHGIFLLAIDIKLRNRPYTFRREKIHTPQGNITVWEIGGKNENEILEQILGLIEKTKQRFF